MYGKDLYRYGLIRENRKMQKNIDTKIRGVYSEGAMRSNLSLLESLKNVSPTSLEKVSPTSLENVSPTSLENISPTSPEKVSPTSLEKVYSEKNIMSKTVSSKSNSRDSLSLQSNSLCSANSQIDRYIDR